MKKFNKLKDSIILMFRLSQQIKLKKCLLKPSKNRQIIFLLTETLLIQKIKIKGSQKLTKIFSKIDKKEFLVDTI